MVHFSSDVFGPLGNGGLTLLKQSECDITGYPKNKGNKNVLFLDCRKVWGGAGNVLNSRKMDLILWQSLLTL